MISDSSRNEDSRTPERRKKDEIARTFFFIYLQAGMRENRRRQQIAKGLDPDAPRKIYRDTRDTPQERLGELKGRIEEWLQLSEEDPITTLGAIAVGAFSAMCKEAALELKIQNFLSLLGKIDDSLEMIIDEAMEDVEL